MMDNDTTKKKSLSTRMYDVNSIRTKRETMMFAVYILISSKQLSETRNKVMYHIKFLP